MTLSPLTLIPAGAGSGKTYTLQQQLGEWVVAGKVKPERIMAVTFTEAAAAELRERIRAKLLDLDRLDDALKLDQAYISTIHGFGLRILTEFAFDTGLSPQPRLLNEDEEDTLIRLALARTDKADEITADLARFGYTYDFNSGKSAEDVFRADLLKVVSQLRAVGWKTGSTDAVAPTVDWIRARYGPTGDGAALTETLRTSVVRLLEAFPECLEDGFGNNATAKRALRTDFRNLCRAITPGVLETDWKLWAALRTLRTSKKGSPLPDAYDTLAQAVKDAANALPRHPGPLTQAETHIRALLAAGQDVLEKYAEAKRQAGLVDYNDMIAMAGDMLRERPEVLAALVDRIDCLVIDEFQDTNPLQFALLWQLREAGVPTVVVGDLKQAIMGFQGADCRLFEQLIRRHHDVANPLERNWRSAPPIMTFINALGPELFGADYVSLAPQGSDTALAPLEAVVYPKAARRSQHQVRAAGLARRLMALLEDPLQQVLDRRTKQRRRLRGGDIAVLCPTHKMLSEYATVLRGLGLRVRLQEDGWFSSRAVQIAWHALTYVANPADRHAALYLAVTELGDLGLEEALRQLMETGRIEEPLLKRLDVLAPGVADRTVYALVADVIAALDLFDHVAVWPEGEQERANLLRLLAEVSEFMDANREALAQGGFHGAGVQSFLAWLAVKTEGKGKNAQPDPRVLDEDAIELVTWHASKGREWPIVAVGGLDRDIKAKLPQLALGYQQFDEFTKLLECAQLEYSPTFAATETNQAFLADLQKALEKECRRLLYVALTRPREKLILEWPEFLAGKDKVTYWSILHAEAGLVLQDEAFHIGDQSFPCLVHVYKAIEADEKNSQMAEGTLPSVGRRAVHAGNVPEKITPDSVTPSGLQPTETSSCDVALEVVSYGGALVGAPPLTGKAFGSFLHRCFEVLGTNLLMIEHLDRITGVSIEDSVRSDIKTSVARFESWINERWSPISVSRELPLLGLDQQGSVVSGTADLVVETADGVWILDHKSDQVDEPTLAFLPYRPQLMAYAAALKAVGATVKGVGIHWIRRGEVVLEAM
ncbi:MAG: DNA helicase UvrD [Porticoccaceae bacterium]|nr:DNA helicase UvrD [Porticoccaceae bacterium]